jgi:hypothetical protein
MLAEESEHEHHSETDDQVGKTDPVPEIIFCLDTVTSDEAQIHPKLGSPSSTATMEERAIVSLDLPRSSSTSVLPALDDLTANAVVQHEKTQPVTDTQELTSLRPVSSSPCLSSAKEDAPLPTPSIEQASTMPCGEEQALVAVALLSASQQYTSVSDADSQNQPGSLSQDPFSPDMSTEGVLIEKDSSTLLSTSGTVDDPWLESPSASISLPADELKASAGAASEKEDDKSSIVGY